MKADVTSSIGVRSDRRHASLARLAPTAPIPVGESVLFESRGTVLVVGDDARVVPHATALARALKVVVCAPGAQDTPGLPPGVVALGGRIVSISGRMGAFSARAAVSRAESADIGPFGPNADQTFDLVLDLSRTPHVAQQVLPLGYFAPGDDADALVQALATLPTLVGRFAKPRYFEYTAQLCTHGSQGLTGCTRCLDACSTSAISSAGDLIAVDPYLCQGCATCMLACPTGALTFEPAPRGTLLAHTEQAIAEAQHDAVADPVLVIRTAGSGVADQNLPESARAIDVPAIPAFGDELWFAALAQGAAGLVLVDDETAPPRTRELLGQRVALAQEILAAAGTRREAITLAAPDSVAQHVAAAAADAPRHARVSKPDPHATKRALTLAAIDTLTSGIVTGPHPLANDAAFGDVVVDRTKCTVCRACVNLCPTGALIGKAEPRPMLSFVEARCVQCGLCEAGCPETAISLAPRFVADAAARSAARVLHEDELVRCTSCGTPFIAVRLLATSLARMQDFPGLMSTGGIERLKMCPACRQRESLIAEG